MADNLSRRLFLVFAFLSLAQHAASQGTSGSFTGAVSDSTGAVIPAAAVTATSVDSGRTWRTQTNEVGVYNLPAVPPGTYTLVVEAAGFKRLATNALTLEVNQVARLDLKLELGTVGETVEVQGLAPLLQTETTQLGSVISGTTTVNLPLNGRNFVQLSLLAPGVVTYDFNSFTGGSTGGGQPLVNGNRAQANNYRLDGMDANETEDNVIAYSPNVDAIQEFKLITTNPPAEYGNSMGGIINTTLKSGTNQYHGSLFEFLRNDKLNANTWFGNATRQPRTHFNQNIFGGTLGGPIKKNRLFFFADYQGWDRALGTTNSAFTVIPAAWRTGNLSSLSAQIYDPQTQTQPTPGTYVRQPFPNNQIPLARINPVALNLFKDSSIYPLPLINSNSNNWNGAGKQNIVENIGDAKVDYTMSNQDTLMGRFSKGQNDNTPVSALRVNPTQPAITKTISGVINWNHTFNPRVLNEARVGVNRFHGTTLTSDTGNIGNLAQQIGIPGGNSPGPGLPLLTIAGVSSLGNRGSDSITATTTYQYTDSLTFSKGNHLFKTGAEVLRYQQNRFYGSNNGIFGAFDFNGSYTSQIGVNNTGSGVADFLLGYPDNVGKSLVAPWGQRSVREGYFFQDDFKVRRNLTLNLGLRYEYITPYVEVADRQSNFDMSTGKQLFAGKNGNSRALYNAYGKGFQPRFGLAWTPERLHDRLVIRMGYGILNYLEATGTNRRLTLNPPYVYDLFVQYDNRFIGQSISDGFTNLVPGSTPSGSLRVWPNVLKPAIIQQWNVTTEYQISSGLTLSVAYVGEDATHLMLSDRYWSQAVPGPGPVQQRRRSYSVLPLATEIVVTDPILKMNYQGLQASLRKRFSKGLEFTASYTYSHAMSNNAGFYGTAVNNSANPQNYSDLRAEWGPASMDIRHNFIASTSYELPFGTNKRFLSGASRVTNAVLGGWVTSGVLTLRTGLPLTIVEAADVSNTGSSAPRPNVLSNPILSSGQQTPSQWFNTSVFVTQAPGTFGNAGPGIVRNPGITNFDFALQKRIPITETKYFEFRAEVFNLSNTPLFTQVGNSLGGSSFGKITTAQAERQLQFGLKLYF
jgi:Carboxypeptidase regulatory-like domain